MQTAPRLIRIAHRCLWRQAGCWSRRASASRTALGPAQAEAVIYTPPPPLPPPPSACACAMAWPPPKTATGAASPQLRDSATDPLVRRMLQWRWAASTDAPLYFADIKQALDELQGWPGRTTMRTRAEQAIFDFASLAERAHRLPAPRRRPDHRRRPHRSRHRAEGIWPALRSQLSLPARAWREDACTDARRATRAERIRRRLHRRRLRRPRRCSVVARSTQRRAASVLTHSRRRPRRRQARIALQTRQRRGLQAAVDAVPASRANNPGLLYDRAQYRRRTDQPVDAMQIAAQIDASQAPLAARDDIFNERRLYVPRALRAGNPRLAYRLVSNHWADVGRSLCRCGMVVRLDFAALSQRAPPARAEHFAHLSENVSSPVSRSRALYWRAEAARRLGPDRRSRALLQRSGALSTSPITASSPPHAATAPPCLRCRKPRRSATPPARASRTANWCAHSGSWREVGAQARFRVDRLLS